MQCVNYIFYLFIYLFIYGCVGSSFLCEGFLLVVASVGHSSSRCAGLSLSRPLLLRSTGSRRAGSVVVAHGPSCSAACGIFPYQGSNAYPLHWQADSQPLRHQGSPQLYLNKPGGRGKLQVFTWLQLCPSPLTGLQQARDCGQFLSTAYSTSSQLTSC